MSGLDINELLSRGEGVDIECKKAADTCPKAIWETYSAFANTKGGWILLGISEKRSQQGESIFSVSGVADVSKVLAEFWNAINSDKVSANLLLEEDVEVLEHQGKSVIAIHVSPADYRDRPVYINGNPMKGTYRRNHEGDYHCREAEIKAMFRDAADTGNDVGVLEGFTLEDLDRETLQAYRREFEYNHPDHVWNRLDDGDFLRNLGAMGKDRKTGKVWLTAAGLLLLGTGVAIRERFSNIRLDYLDKANLAPGSRWSHRLTYDGMWENNLYQFVRRIFPWMSEGVRRPFRMEGMVRQDDTPIHTALREAVINMVIHADYMMTGVLQVVKEDKRITFANPGFLKLPTERIYEGGHAVARNPVLQNMLRMIGLGENIGSGFSKILSAWSEAGWPRPEIHEDLALGAVELVLTFGESKEGTIPDSKTDEAILMALKNGAVKMKDITSMIGLSPSGTAKAVNKLISEGRIVRSRRGRQVYYTPRIERQ